MITTEEVGGVPPTLAMEEGTITGMEATEEGEGSAAMIIKEEATKDILIVPTEEVTDSVSMVSMGGRSKGPLITTSEEKFSGQTDMSSISLVSISEQIGPSLIQVTDASCRM